MSHPFLPIVVIISRILPVTALAPQPPPLLVLEPKADLSWLEETLNALGIRKTNGAGVQKKLTKILSSPVAIWVLCSLLLQWLPDSELLKDPSPLTDGPSSYEIVNIKAYVVYVDMVQNKEIAFKLTPRSISELTGYHEIHLINIYNGWPDEAAELQNKFIESVNEFIYRMSDKALLDLEPHEFGPNGFSDGRSDEAKSAIMGLFHKPPPPSNITTAKIIQRLPSPTIGNRSVLYAMQPLTI